MQAKLKYIPALLLLLPGLKTLAQFNAFQDTARIATVVVRSVPTRDTLRLIPAAVGVLDKDLLSQNDGSIVTSLINQVPGVYMQQGALNTNRISIRGIGARSQYSTNRVKAYIDGIPISSAAGTTVIEDIDLDVLESMEIIKGPASGIYGTGLGGVINMFTKDKPTENLRIESTIGSFGLMKNTIGAGFSTEKASLQATYNHLSSDGFRQNGSYDRKSFTLNGGYKLSEKTDIRLLAILTRMKGFIPSSINREDFENNPRTADANWAASEGFESYDKAIAGLALNHRFSGRFSNTTSVFGQVRDAYEPRPFDILVEQRFGAGARTHFNLLQSIFGNKAQLAFGAEYLVEDYEGGTYQNRFREFPGQGSVEGMQLSGNTQLRQNLNIFAQQRLQLSERFALEAGLNLNSTNYALIDLFANDTLDQSGDYRFGTVVSPRVGATYRLRANQVLYATVSHGFSAPGVEETLTPSGQVNTDLLPETGINYETGFKADWLGGKLYSEIALYTVDIRNLLVARRIAEDQFIGINAGRTQHTGAELLFSFHQMIGAQWIIKPYLNGSLHHYRFTEFVDDDRDYSGNAVTGVPSHTANAGLEAHWTKGLRLRANLLHVGEIPLNDANFEYSDSYALLNFQCSYETSLFKALRIRLQAGVNNALNVNYAASVLPNAIGFGGNAPRYFYPGDARAYYLGLSISY